jgi:hypothetical protein
MDAPGRSRILIGLALIICLALTGSWILLREHTSQTPPPPAAMPAAADVRVSDATPEVTPPPRASHALRGRVYDEASGKGIEAASVVVRFESKWPTGTSVTSQEDGSFVIDDVPLERALLEVSASGFADRQMRIAIADDTAPLQIGLTVGRAISGAVTGVKPEELRQVAVVVSRDGEADSRLFSLLDSAGNFVIRGVRPGDVQLTAQFRDRWVRKAVRMPADTDIRVDVDFPSGARLSGRTLSRGNPIPGVRVEAHLMTGPSAYAVQTFSSADGQYVFESIDKGEYVIAAGGKRNGPLQIESNTVLDLEVPAARVSGSVQEAAGEVPIVGATVQIWSAEGPSSAVANDGEHLSPWAAQPSRRRWRSIWCSSLHRRPAARPTELQPRRHPRFPIRPARIESITYGRNPESPHGGLL